MRARGMLASGVLNIRALDEGEVMDRNVYVELIEDNLTIGSMRL